MAEQRPLFTFDPEFIKACQAFNKAMVDGLTELGKQLEKALEETRRERQRKDH